MATDYGTTDSQIKDIRERMELASTEWEDIRKEGRKDMMCIAGDVWEAMDPEGTKQRKNAKRPMIHSDELGQYVNQVINGLRANKRAIKYSPNGNGANEKGAEFYANKFREIEYRSKAQVAYITAAENAVQRSYGWVRVITKRYNPRSSNQDICIEAIHNPDMVLPGPAVEPDSSDQKFLFYFELWDQEEFKRSYPKAKKVDFTSYITDVPFWVREKQIVLAEYWQIQTKTRTLLEFPELPEGIFEDEVAKFGGLPPGLSNPQTREVEWPTVSQCLTNGLEILSETPWPGKYIPFVSCFGKVIYVDNGAGAERRILSMTRLARSPQMLYDYYCTTQAEIMGLTPKTPYMAYKGQLDPSQMLEIQKSLHEPVAVIEVNPTTDATGSNLLPFPIRQPYEPHIESTEIGAESARRKIQAAIMGAFLPTQAQRRNEKSGIALEKIDQKATQGSFHFNDHYDGMIQHVGVIIEDLMDKIYDTKRQVGVRKPNEQAEMITVNDPANKESITTKGDYLATISTGPSYDSEQERASEFADLLMQNEMFAPRVAHVAVKLKNLGPIGDELAELVTPPDLAKPKEGEEPSPQQLQQMLGQMQQENQQLKQVLQQIALDLKTKKVETESRERIAAAQIASQEKIAGVKAATDVGTTTLELNTERAIAVMEAQIELLKMRLDTREAMLGRRHESALSSQDHAESLEAGEQSMRAALVQGQQSGRQALEQGEQAHGFALEQLAMQPESDEGA